MHAVDNKYALLGAIRLAMPSIKMKCSAENGVIEILASDPMLTVFPDELI